MPRLTVNQPDAPDVYTKLYNKFAGVDFSTDPARVEDYRSPHAVNIISDLGGYPEKRVGWRTLTRVMDSESYKADTINLVPEGLNEPNTATLSGHGFELTPSDVSAAYEDMKITVTGDDDAYVKCLRIAVSADENICGIRFKCPSWGSGTYNLKLSTYYAGNNSGAETEIAVTNTEKTPVKWTLGVNFGDQDGGYSRECEKQFYFDIDLSSSTDTYTLWFKCNGAVTGAYPTHNRIYLTAMTFNKVDEHPLPINNISWFGSASCYLVHAGTKIYKWDGKEELTQMYENVNDARSTTLIAERRMLILTGREYLVFDGEKIVPAGEAATVPYIIKGRDCGTTPANWGDTYQPINMLSKKVRIGFTVAESDAEANAKYLNVSGLGLAVKCKDDVSVYTINGTGEKVAYDIASLVIAGGEEITGSEVMEAESGLSGINLSSALPISSPDGADTVWVEAPREDNDYSDRINKCTIMTNFQNRVFFSGNPDFPNTDWYSELHDPLYVSDLSYTEVGEIAERDGVGGLVGEGGSAIVGYARVGEQLAIFKESGGQDATLFLRTAEMTDSGMIFPIKQGIVGDGVISHATVATLHDDPLFLTRSGVYAIASADITAERVMQARSTRVNARLTGEENLSQAVAVTWRGHYVLCVNGNAYIADGRQKSYARNLSGAYEYEWYFWDNIPAQVLCEHDEALFFGTQDGRLCRFNTDIDGMSAYNDDGAAIVAEWATALSDDGDFNLLKHLRRRGSGVHLKSYDRGGVKVIVRTDRDFGVENVSAYRGIFSFENLNFEYFTFNTSPNSFVMFKKKVKNYRLIQVICRNDEINQGFGVYAIERRFVKGYFGK